MTAERTSQRVRVVNALLTRTEGEVTCLSAQSTQTFVPESSGHLLQSSQVGTLQGCRWIRVTPTFHLACVTVFHTVLSASPFV